MKFKDFINEAPMMVDDRVKKTPDSAQKFADEVYKQAIEAALENEDASWSFDYVPKFKFVKEFSANGYKFEEFALHEYGNVYIVSKGEKLCCILKYDRYEKKYFSIDVIDKQNATSEEIIEIIYVVAKKTDRIGLLSGTHQTSGGRSMWRNIIKYADKHDMKFGHTEGDKYIETDKNATDFIKFADDELYDNTDKRDRSKMKLRLYVDFK